MITAKKKYGFEPDYAIPPGETIKDVIESLDMTQKELAIRTELTEQSLIRIIKGQQPITYETANKLELTTGVPASMWNNLEAQYREQLAKIEEKKQLEKDLDWLKTIPTKELVERDAIPKTKDKVKRLRDVLAFFGVSSVKAWNDLWESPQKIAARRSTCFESSPGPTATWIRLGILNAQQIECEPHDKSKFADALKEIRMLTVKEPSHYAPEMQRLCAKAGVALVFVPEMKKVPWNGATKWLSPHKAMIILNIRGKGEDRFWFSFFHEAAHVLKDSKKDLHISENKSDDPIEQRADKYAAEILIPSTYNSEIRLLRSKRQVIQFANRLGISQSIVAGRYQYLTSKWGWYKDLIRPLKWVTKEQ